MDDDIRATVAHRVWRAGDPEPGPAPYTDGCHTSRQPAPAPLGPCVTLPDIDRYQPEETRS